VPLSVLRHGSGDPQADVDTSVTPIRFVDPLAQPGLSR